MDRKTMVKKKHEEQGFILVLSVIIMTCLLLLVTPFLFQLSTDNRISQQFSKSYKALILAEAGVDRAIWTMNKGDISTWSGEDDLRTLTISSLQSSNGDVIGDIQIRVLSPEGENPVIESTGSVECDPQPLTRMVRVMLKYNSPIPHPQNAINIFGSPSKHATLKIMDHDKNPKGKILISGLDAAGGPAKLALGVEESEQLTAIIENMGKQKDKGNDLQGMIVGDPTRTWEYGTEGKSFEASIGLVSSDEYIDCETMETYVQQLADGARAMTPTQTFDLGGNEKDDTILDPDGDGYVYLGGSENDVIYLTNGELKLEKDLTITGKGTLILDGGKMELKNVSSFNWEGDIYILGDESKGDAIFKVKKGVCDIIGDIYLLGSNNGKAKLDFCNDDTGENDSYTKIVGSILASGGSGDNSKAEMRVHHGDVDIEGMISLIGNKTKLDLHQKYKIHGKEGAWLENDDSDIKIKGGISLLVSDASKESTDQKAEIKIHAHEQIVDEYWEGMIEIIYDSDIVRAATKRFAKNLGLVGRFHVVSWNAK